MTGSRSLFTVVGLLGVVVIGLDGAAAAPGAVAHAAMENQYDRQCSDDDYLTAGHNDDRSDDGCDTTRYGNTGHNGDSAPDSYNYGHGRADDDKPLGSGLFEGL